jgi:hypothetical protein
VLEEPEGYDPFRRVYLYGEEGQAAEDTPFVFFQAWWLPVACACTSSGGVRRRVQVGVGDTLGIVAPAP